MKREELAARLLATFLAELDDQVRTMNEDLLALEAGDAAADRLKSLFRSAHTLKGAATAAGVPVVAEACHALESLLAAARDGEHALGPGEITLLFAAADALGDAGLRLRAGRDLAGAPLASLAEQLSARPGGPAPPPRGDATGPVPPVVVRERGDGQVRIEGVRLDALLAATGQLLVTGSRLAGLPGGVEALHQSVAQCAATWGRQAHRIRLALERDAASPALAQVVAVLDEGLRRLSDDAARLTTQAVADVRALDLVTGEVTDHVRRLRMRPFREACEALPRVVRDLAAATGKDIALEVVGGEVEADRAVLDGLREAMLHMVRNAVDHGIEAPVEREKTGKARRGRITVAAEVRGTHLRVSVADDGAGIATGAVRSALERRGYAIPGDEREMVRLLFQGGLSTAGAVTAVSGRGVGLDIVRAAVERIRGTVDVQWVPGGGTTFTLECPPSLATIRVLLVVVGRHLLAIPSSHVERVMRVRPDELGRVEDRDVVRVGELPVPLVPLARLVPPLVERPGRGPMLIVLLRSGDRRLAAVVDELLTEQEVVLRPVDCAAPLPLVSGATILGTGQVALVLNPAPVVAAGLGLAQGTTPLERPAGAEAARRRVLVVDDSITTRTLEQSILEAAGYEVLTAVDGADGWRALQERSCDLVVTDVEMPRMDGFELCQTIRGSRQFKDLPVVLVTALESAEHRTRGLEAGADAYLGKSSFEQQSLLDAVQQLIGTGEP